MAISLSDDVIGLVDGRNFAHLATIMSDGSPHSAPVWVGREDNHLIVCTDEGSVKARNTARDPRVAISIINLKDPYSEAQLRGRVVERRRDVICLMASRASMWASHTQTTANPQSHS
jgi:PPOX class probable F420-dependent enzyme